MKENKVIKITLVLNLIVAILKLTAGVAFSFSTLIADSVQSFMDVITDITSLIANKIGKRRANKTFPFGYGQVYYIANLFTGFLLFLIGIFILYQLFFFKGVFKPNSILFVVLAIVLVLKGIVVLMLKNHGKRLKSEMMIESSKESGADFISTCVVLLVSVVVLFEEYIPSYINIDKIGSAGMALYVFFASFSMIVSNLKGMLATTEGNDNVKNMIIAEIEEIEGLEFKRVKVIKMSSYYSVFLQVNADENITVGEYLELEKKLKRHIKAQDELIRFIDVELV